jgi:excisionase family DNA binding protein
LQPSGHNSTENTSYTVAELARALKVAPRTIRSWIASGQLAAFNVSAGTIRPHYRVTEAAVRSFIEERNISKVQP